MAVSVLPDQAVFYISLARIRARFIFVFIIPHLYPDFNLVNKEKLFDAYHMRLSIYQACKQKFFRAGDVSWNDKRKVS